MKNVDTGGNGKQVFSFLRYTHRFTLTNCELIIFAGDNVLTCGAKKTKKTVNVVNGETYTFKTNVDGGQYGANVRCVVKYKRTEGCKNKNLRITCSKFSLGRGDFLRINRKRENM